jgi:perosamine synthetase
LSNRARLIPPFAVSYGLADFAVGLAALVSRMETLPEAPKEIFGNRPMFWTNSGRQALWLILRALRLQSGARVAIPLYGSSSVVSTVRSAGYVPEFLDVEESTLTLDPAAVARAKGRVSAIVVEHLFGHAARMDELLDAAAGVPIIEDTAQAPLSYLRGRLAGTFGIASFYSFASSKYLPAGGGGLAAVNDPQLAVTIAEQVNGLNSPDWTAECRGILIQAAKAVLLRRPCYGFLGSQMRSATECHPVLAAKLNSNAIQRSSAATVLRQASSLAARVQQQHTNSVFLLSRLACLDGITLPWERVGTTYNYHLFPVLVRNEEERLAVMAGMRERGVESSRVHFDVVRFSAALGYRSGCPVAESVASRMLTLPNQAGLSSDDLGRVTTAFQGALGAYRARSRGLAVDALPASRINT